MSTVVGLTADATVAMIDAAKARATHTGTQLASTISDLVETTQDLMSTTLLPGTNTTITYNDAAGTITIASTASGIVEGIALSAYTNGAGSAAANTTAIQNAINAAAAAGKPLLNDLGAITVSINARINILFNGFRARFNGLKLNQTTANTAGVRIGGISQDIDGLSVYCSTNPASGATNANAFEFTNVAFSRYSNLIAENACRGFYMPQSAPAIGDPASNTVFSCVFENIRINGWSLSAIDFQTWVAGSAASTGNVWNNIYLHNNFFGSPAASAAEAIIFRAFNDNIFNQLNIEWGTYTTNVTFFQECFNSVFNSVHIEGNTLSGSGVSFLRGYFATRLTFHAVTLVNNTIANVVGQRSVFKMFSNSSVPASLDVTSVIVYSTVNAGSRPFALIEIESGSNMVDAEFRKIDLQDFVSGVVVDATGVSPAQVKSYNDVNFRTPTFPAVTATAAVNAASVAATGAVTAATVTATGLVTSAGLSSSANIVAPNVWVDLVRTTDASAVQSTTKASDAVLTFATTAGTYIIEGMLVYTNPTAAALKLQYNCTGTITRAKFSSIGLGSGATTQTFDGNFEATPINTDGGWGGAALNEVALQFKGVLTVSTSGVFTIQYGQYVSTSPGLVVKATSRLSYRKIS